MKIRWFFYLLWTSTSIWAQGVDVYGLNLKESTLLLQKYELRISQIINQIHEGITQDPDHFLDTSQGEKLLKQRNALLHEIKENNHFIYVDLETIYYQPDNFFTTLEVIPAGKKERLKFVTPKQPNHYPKTDDVMDQMQAYLTLSRSLFIKNQLRARHDECPVYHCTLGFKHPQLRGYLAVFNQAAAQDKQFIINTLKHDPNPERRANAAYLVGHFTDPHEIIRTLLPQVSDSDEGVRNNVIRVLSVTSMKSGIKNIDPAPFVYLLDSPFLVDRNKSLFLLANLASEKSTRNYLIEHAQTQLLRLYAMKQPNQQEFAYMILKEISGKDFGENQVVEWEKWFKHERAKIA